MSAGSSYSKLHAGVKGLESDLTGNGPLYYDGGNLSAIRRRGNRSESVGGLT